MTRQIAPFISILSFIKVDGKKVYEPAKVFKEGVNWPIVLAIGALSAIGGLVVSDEAGVKVWLSDCLSSQFTNFGFVGYLIFAIAAAAYPSRYPPIHCQGAARFRVPLLGVCRIWEKTEMSWDR